LLNDLFEGQKTITDLIYNKNEHVGDTEELGSVIFDLTCTSSDNEQFIIEVQRNSQINLKSRILYYGSKLITDQAPKGSRRLWNYQLSEVYVIVLMDGFSMPGSTDKDRYIHHVCLGYEGEAKKLYDGLGYKFIELVNF